MEKIFIDGKELRRYLYNGLKTNYFICEDGNIYNDKTCRFMTQNSLDSNGRRYVCLSINNNPIRKPIHRLVAEVFIRHIEEGETVDHKDNNKLNNHFTNLEIISREENVRRFISKNKIYEKYSDEFVRELLALLKEGKYYKDVADLYKIDYSYLYQLSHGKIRVKLFNEFSPLPISATRRTKHRAFLDKYDELASLIKDGFSNKEICEIMSVQNNNANSKVIMRIRKNLGIRDPKYFDKAFIMEIDHLIQAGLNNEEIINQLCLERDERLTCLLARERKKLDVPNIPSLKLNKKVQERIYSFIKEGRSNMEIIEELKLTRNPYITNLFGRLRKRFKKELCSTTIES